MGQPKCSVAGCDNPASIYLSSIEHCAVLWHLGACREHADDLFTRECQKVPSDRPVRPGYAGMANVDLRFVLFDCAKQPHEGPATIGLSEADATGRLVIGRIGFCEASALDMALKQQATPRPLTYPLMAQIIDAFGACRACRNRSARYGTRDLLREITYLTWNRAGPRRLQTKRRTGNCGDLRGTHICHTRSTARSVERLGEDL